MLSIVHWEVHCDDYGNLTAIEAKIKCVDESEESTRHFVTNIYSAFSNTTLLDDAGRGINIYRDDDNNRKDVADLMVKLEKDNKLSDEDAAKFIKALRKALYDIKPLF